MDASVSALTRWIISPLLPYSCLDISELTLLTELKKKECLEVVAEYSCVCLCMCTLI